eukprot:CAMPEP_0171606076 /NCGR_PEP_ID=MMETSP0990-20121206/7552_1 /TAXON_ID=483369 /ORGANISM="non described non described, Strain CCMP2098" /LENGTH=168 /DNA_ID=CAMNT_0012168853 /DNA_START=240 /DNA_END=746 /DNA_ORIENTATION=+
MEEAEREAAAFIRSSRNIGRNELDLDQFIVEEDSNKDLPDFVKSTRGLDAKKDGNEDQEAPADLSTILEGVGRIINPPKTENSKPSEDFFDRGLGLLVKNSVFACAAALIFWEFYIASPLFSRELPMLSFEEALGGGGTPPLEKAAPSSSTAVGQAPSGTFSSFPGDQ